MYSGNGVNVTPRPKKERKVSVVFRHPDTQKHCAGVESLVLPSVANRMLFTASRDSTVKRWNLDGPEPCLEASFEGHADWVNDVALINDLLVTCSNDQTVRLWKAGSPNGQHLHTASYHSDYVTCLAVASSNGIVVSGGLRSEIFLLRIENGQYQQLYPRPHSSQSTLEDGPKEASRGSIYSLAMNDAGTLVAAGTSEHLIRLLDPRSGKKITKLRGHQDTVRALVVNPEGTTILSGGSDATIRLWDVGMQRCVQTYSVHQDSVWSLLASDDFSVVYSGGRDRAIYRTHLAHRATELLAVEEHPVRRLARDPHENALWVATTSSTVHKWPLPREMPGAGTMPEGSRSFSAARRSHGYASGARARPSLDMPAMQPLSRAPTASVPGLPGIVQHEVLTDRRHILAKDSDGVVSLWDVLMGEQVQVFGKVDFDATRKQLFEPKSLPGWFTSDNRLGQLCITLEPPGCFMAEEYAQNLDYPQAPDDFKINFGKLVLDGVFAKWRAKVAAAATTPNSSGTPAASSPDGGEGGGQQYYREAWPKYWQCRSLPAVMCSTYQGQRWRRLLGQFSGQELEPDEVPTWVADVVHRGANVTPKEAKCAFILLPAEGSNLPSLMQSKLNAPKILQVYKVAQYCISKLQDQGLVIDIKPVYLRRPQQAPPDSPEVPGRPVLELTCNGVAVPYEVSLAAVKKYIWKKSDDLVFHFRATDPHSMAPLPTFDVS